MFHVWILYILQSPVSFSLCQMLNGIIIINWISNGLLLVMQVMQWHQQKHHWNHHVLYLSSLFPVHCSVLNMQFGVSLFSSFRVFELNSITSSVVGSSLLVIRLFTSTYHLSLYFWCWRSSCFFRCLYHARVNVHLFGHRLNFSSNGWMTWENKMNYVETFVIKLANAPSKLKKKNKHEFHKSIWTIYWLLSRKL